MIGKMTLIGAAGLLLTAFGASAKDVPCGDLSTQREMTSCEQVRFLNADKALNKQYKVTKPSLPGEAREILVKAQRAWVGYRDGHCEAEGYAVHGGSMEPMVVAACKANITSRRTIELKTLAESMDPK